MKNLSLIIFGISGDLACRALIPSLYQLFTQGQLAHCMIIGISQEVWSLEDMHNHCKEHIKTYNHASWHLFIQQCILIALDATNTDAYTTLYNTLIIEEKKRNLSGNRIFYCATDYTLFLPITKNLHITHLLTYQEPSTTPWNRICYEKPFGSSSQQAEMLYNQITTYIHSEQLFLVDHFLAKNVIDSFIIERATNRFFQALWDNKNIDSITITLHETDTLEQRGAFYDKIGVLHDVVQNHILQLLALTLMKIPCSLNHNDIRQEKITALKDIVFYKGLLGQYKNYTNEQNIAPHSTTPTYAHLMFQSTASQWHTVVFTISTGKALSENKTAITITLKPSTDCSLAPEGTFYPNTITFLFSPLQELHITLNTKQSHTHTVTNTELSLCKKMSQQHTIVDAYTTIFTAVADNNQTAFATITEIILAWNIIKTITHAHLPLFMYEKGSQAPFLP